MRARALVAMLCGSLLGLGAVPGGSVYEASAVEEPSRMPRVRAQSDVIAAVIRNATEQSSTFHALLTTIDATDGLVFVEEGRCGHSVRACLLLSVKVAGPSRLLRIRVDATKPDCQLTADIGHELQHAIEILSDPHVRDMQSAYSLFERIGPTGSERFETPAALRAGDQIGDECRTLRR
jgi:hypothetical protein